MTFDYKEGASKQLRVNDFFSGWSHRPSQAVFDALLQGSDYVITAVELRSQDPVGFITAITDDVLSAYIPFVEVMPKFQGLGIGTELVKRMLSKLQDFYMIDLVCDESLCDFYAQFGMERGQAMSIRNYAKQDGQARL